MMPETQRCKKTKTRLRTSSEEMQKQRSDEKREAEQSSTWANTSRLSLYLTCRPALARSHILDINEARRRQDGGKTSSSSLTANLRVQESRFKYFCIFYHIDFNVCSIFESNGTWTHRLSDEGVGDKMQRSDKNFFTGVRSIKTRPAFYKNVFGWYVNVAELRLLQVTNSCLLNSTDSEKQTQEMLTYSKELEKHQRRRTQNWSSSQEQPLVKINSKLRHRNVNWILKKQKGPQTQRGKQLQQKTLQASGARLSFSGSGPVL